MERLSQMNILGLEEVGYGEFGLRGIVSGLYIEKVWNFSNEEWSKYVEWMMSVVKKKK